MNVIMIVNNFGKTPVRNINLIDCEPNPAEFRRDVLDGFRKKPKQIPAKYFYDAEGSRIYEKICDLEEYYPTRCEVEILQKNAEEISDFLGPRSSLIELGSGNSRKIRFLLKVLPELKEYIPVDISKGMLIRMGQGLAKDFPHLPISALCGDYLNGLEIKDHLRHTPEKKVVFFPGSNIGNLHPNERDGLLKNIHRWVEKGGGLLIGVDLKKRSEYFSARLQ